MKFSKGKFNKEKLNREKFKVLHLERNNPRHQCMLCTTQRECCLIEKDLGFQLVTKLNVKQQCTLVSKQANSILGCIRWSMSREAVFPLCLVLVKPRLEYCVQFWAFQYKRDMVILKTVQQRATKMTKRPEHFLL